MAEKNIQTAAKNAQSKEPEIKVSQMFQALARSSQQYFYELFADLYEFNPMEHEHFKFFIACALFGPPNTNNVSDSTTCAGIELYDAKQMNVINSLYKILCERGQQDEKSTIWCGILYNVVFEIEANEISMKCETKGMDNKNEIICPKPVFRLKKNESCYYIDEIGRVYKSWLDYLENNTLGPCIMALPKDGSYKADPKQEITVYNSLVWLEFHRSPSCKLKRKVLNGMDIFSGTVGIAGTAAMAVSMVTPIGPIALTAGLACATASGVWSIARASSKLTDRYTHEQSIGLHDPLARNAWISIGGTTLGIAATGGSALLSRAVIRGANISRAATLAYETVNVGSVVMNGIGLSVDAYEMYMNYKKTNEISKGNVLSLVTHIFFFGASVVNFKLAKELIHSTQGQVLNEFENSLRSNRHRKEFHKLMRRTITSCGDKATANAEIIRGIRNISNKDEFFASMVRLRKTFNRTKSNAWFKDGNVVINGKDLIDPIKFSQLPRNERVQLINGVLEQSSNISVRQKRNWINFKASAMQKASTFPSVSSYHAGKGYRLYKNLVLSNSSELSQHQVQDTNNFTFVNSLIKEMMPFHCWQSILTGVFNLAMKLVTDPRMNLRKSLAEAVDFVWSYIKENIFRVLPLLVSRHVPAPHNNLAKNIIHKLCHLAESEMDRFVEAFKKWLIGTNNQEEEKKRRDEFTVSRISSMEIDTWEVITVSLPKSPIEKLSTLIIVKLAVIYSCVFVGYNIS
ncbi:uncharacterized protein LOC105695179 [Orussus abietinus]|uniref:uncharacterized protein LOC105695179 n=1 Tax=Orussus abietinus TaxID=222816 RepID=UPI000626CC80|nr:uncharacterized protein LOC105695179 [Orussus abietinus]